MKWRVKLFVDLGGLENSQTISSICITKSCFSQISECIICPVCWSIVMIKIAFLRSDGMNKPMALNVFQLLTVSCRVNFKTVWNSMCPIFLFFIILFFGNPADAHLPHILCGGCIPLWPKLSPNHETIWRASRLVCE